MSNPQRAVSFRILQVSEPLGEDPRPLTVADLAIAACASKLAVSGLGFRGLGFRGGWREILRREIGLRDGTLSPGSDVLESRRPRGWAAPKRLLRAWSWSRRFLVSF